MPTRQWGLAAKTWQKENDRRADRRGTSSLSKSCFEVRNYADIKNLGLLRVSRFRAGAPGARAESPAPKRGIFSQLPIVNPGTASALRSSMPVMPKAGSGDRGHDPWVRSA